MEANNSQKTTKNTVNNQTPPKLKLDKKFLQEKFKLISKNPQANFLISTLTKPATAIKENISQYSNFKTSWQLPVFIGAFFSVISTISQAFNKVYTPAHKSLFGKQIAASWNWSNLENFDWVQTLFTQFIVHLIPVLLIAVIYYLISLVFKKNSNFFRLVTILTVASLPSILIAYLAAPIVSLFSPAASIILTFSGLSYGSLIAYEAINHELGFKENERIFANLIFITIIYIVIYAIFSSAMQSLFKGNSSQLDLIENLFK